MSRTDTGMTASAVPHRCGHNDDERASATIGIFAGKIRIAAQVAAAVPARYDAALGSLSAAQPVGRAAFATTPIPLNLPLRL
jgi:hypothetical protein